MRQISWRTGSPTICLSGQAIGVFILICALHSGEKNTDCDYFMSIGEVDYKIDNSQLVKDLGVSFDPKLNVNHHIYKITHKATEILGILKRTFLFLDKKTFLLLNKSLIRPHLENANVIWYSKYKYQSLSKECKEEQLNY